MPLQKVSPQSTAVGWIGTGVMGASMCGHIQKAGYRVNVYSRTKSKADALVSGGATWRDTPRAVAEASDVIFAIVGFPHDVREVFLGDDGVLAGSKSGNVIVDMTTSEPSLAVEISEQAQGKGVYAVDAPVSGGDVGAREARLSIMIGGEKEAVDALQPLWETRWARRSCIKADLAPGSTPRWSTRR